MKEIDKMDVDISKLFNWGKKFKISLPGKNKSLDVYMRLVGDADYNRATVLARRKSAELRKKLRDETSDDRIALIPDMESFSHEILVGSLLLFYTRELALQAIREVKIDLPAEPKFEATLEEMEEYQKEVDDYPKKREQAVKDFVNKKIEERKVDLEQRDDKFLYDEYVRLSINQICELETLSKMKQVTVYLGTYKDADYTERLFQSFEDFDNLPETIKNQLMDFYMSLEIDGEDLKK